MRDLLTKRIASRSGRAQRRASHAQQSARLTRITRTRHHCPLRGPTQGILELKEGRVRLVANCAHLARLSRLPSPTREAVACDGVVPPDARRWSVAEALASLERCGRTKALAVKRVVRYVSSDSSLGCAS